MDRQKGWTYNEQDRWVGGGGDDGVIVGKHFNLLFPFPSFFSFLLSSSS